MHHGYSPTHPRAQRRFLHCLRPMAHLGAWLVGSAGLAASACSPDVTETCGFTQAAPSADEVIDGFVVAALGAERFEKTGSWSSGTNGDITAGTLSMVIAFDESGTRVDDLVGRGAFPICIPLGARSPQSGNATYDSRFLSDADHTGMVAIQGQEGAFLTGRFAVTLRDNTDVAAPSIRFEDGAFRIPAR